MRRYPDHLVGSVQKALDAIEDRLRAPLHVERLARDSGMSFWHFQRTFVALVGEPVASYIRRRRLTAAARELRRSRRAIVEIALEFQFDSHETFTRAFRSAFKLTPNAFRRNPVPLRSSRAHLTASRLLHLSRINFQPEIRDCPELHLVGLSTRYIGVTSDQANDMKMIPRLWNEFLPRLPELGADPASDTYGAWDFLPGHLQADPDEYVYLAAVAIAANHVPPADMVKWTAPAGCYARFTHRGPASRIGDTISYIYAAWLPRSGRERGRGFDFSHFNANYDGENGDGTFDYYLPLAR